MTEETIHAAALAELLAVDPAEIAEDVAELDEEWGTDDPFLEQPEDDVLAYLTTWLAHPLPESPYKARSARTIYEWWRKHQPEAGR